MKKRIARQPSRAELARDRALDAISRMRSSGLSLREAAHAAGTTPATVKKHAPRALSRIEGDGYVATKSDRYARTLRFLTEGGKIEVTVHDSRQASLIAKYWDAAIYYLETGRSDRLAPFENLSISDGTTTHRFVTDLRLLRRLGHAGEVAFEDLYAIRG
jgi:hypothetical protein